MFGSIYCPDLGTLAIVFTVRKGQRVGDAGVASRAPVNGERRNLIAKRCPIGAGRFAYIVDPLLVYRLLNPLSFVAFKMGRRQGARRAHI